MAKFFTEISHFRTAEVLHSWAYELALHLQATPLMLASMNLKHLQLTLVAKMEHLGFLYREQGRFVLISTSILKYADTKTLNIGT